MKAFWFSIVSAIALGAFTMTPSGSYAGACTVFIGTLSALASIYFAIQAARA